jgi:hypothetical protein
MNMTAPKVQPWGMGLSIAACLLSMLSILIIGVAGCSASGQEQASTYEITNTTADGWLTPDTKVLVKMPGSKRLALSLEVPGWMPFNYPAKLQITRDGRVDQTFEFPTPGVHKIYIPLDEVGTIGLKIDNWFVPAQLGIGSDDKRQLSYRLKGAAAEDKPG